MAGPRCVNRFPEKPLCKFVDDLAASPLTFLDASAGETIKLGAYDVFQASAIAVSWLSRVVVPPRSSTVTCPTPRCMRTAPPAAHTVPSSFDSSLSPTHPAPPPHAQCEQKFHRDLPDTKVYAYGVSRSSARYPGPVLVATRGTTTKVSAAAPPRRARQHERQQGEHQQGKHQQGEHGSSGTTTKVSRAASALCAARGDSNFNPPLAGPLLPFYLIGSDGGYLARPLRRSSLLVFPATRHDLLLDFNAAPAWCRDVILVNSANIPFPRGQPADWFTGVVMRFIINQEPPVKPPPLPETLSVSVTLVSVSPARQFPPFPTGHPADWFTGVHIPPVDLSQAVRQRFLAVVFVIDKELHEPSAMLLDGKTYMDPATEKPKVGTSELWHIVNPSFEAHPIHLHLIQHRPISRRPFNSTAYLNGSCSLPPSASASSKPSCFTGPARAVPQHERGWKDTTVAWPDSVLTIFVPFKGQVRCGAVWWGGRW
ncbi:unnamed protein product [Closterium sp. Naga37s-1]|nr:unnamed protein product [Closterium sp. Naga37s-1]